MHTERRAIGVRRVDLPQHRERGVVILVFEGEQPAVEGRERGGLEGQRAPEAIDLAQRFGEGVLLEGRACDAQARQELRRRAAPERMLQGAQRRGVDQLMERLMLQGLCVVTSELLRCVTPLSSTVVRPPSSEM